MLNMETLEKFGLDTAEGLTYCADDPEFYEEMILEYLNESADRVEEMERFYGLRNWERYGICAHSLKNTSRMIGAKLLSEQAHELELACKVNDEVLIDSVHERFIKKYIELTDCLHEEAGLVR